MSTISSTKATGSSCPAASLNIERQSARVSSKSKRPTPTAVKTKEGPAIKCAKPIVSPPVSSKSKRSVTIAAKPGALAPTKPSNASALVMPPAESIGHALPHSQFDALRLMAETFSDLQRARISVGNRLGSSQVDQEMTAPILERAQLAEDGAALVMRRTFRGAVPHIAAWVKATKGLGEHLMARLIGAIGDPAIASPMRWTEEPPEDHVCDPKRCGEGRHLVSLPSYRRTVSQLWSYCGHGDPTRKRRKGMTQEEACAGGSPHAKMIVHLMAECCMKCADSPYRAIYDMARITYQSREGWSLGHQHNAALRKVGKEILRDLWVISQNGQVAGHQRAESHDLYARPPLPEKAQA